MEVVDVVMTYDNHSEQILLAITKLGKQKVILGYTWLRKHNLEIDFATGKVKMTRCNPRHCSGCREEVKEEWRSRRSEI